MPQHDETLALVKKLEADLMLKKRVTRTTTVKTETEFEITKEQLAAAIGAPLSDDTEVIVVYLDYDGNKQALRINEISSPVKVYHAHRQDHVEG